MDSLHMAFDVGLLIETDSWPQPLRKKPGAKCIHSGVDVLKPTCALTVDVFLLFKKKKKKNTTIQFNVILFYLAK